IAVNKAFVEYCTAKYERGELTTVEASMAKLSTTELQGKVADECVQLFGGYGYMMEYKIARAYIDARIQRIYGGTSEIMKEIIARSLVGRGLNSDAQPTRSLNVTETLREQLLQGEFAPN